MHAHTLLVAATALLFSLTTAAPAGAVTTPEERELADLFPVPKEQLKCPATCGLLVMDQTEDDYCNTPAYKQHLSKCLACAGSDADTWAAFKDDVQMVAKECGDDATPSASGAAPPAPSATSATSNGGAVFAAANDAQAASASASSSPSSGVQPLPTSSAPAIATGAASALNVNAAAWLAAPALLAAALL